MELLKQSFVIVLLVFFIMSCSAFKENKNLSIFYYIDKPDLDYRKLKEFMKKHITVNHLNDDYNIEIKENYFIVNGSKSTHQKIQKLIKNISNHMLFFKVTLFQLTKSDYDNLGLFWNTLGTYDSKQIDLTGIDKKDFGRVKNKVQFLKEWDFYLSYKNGVYSHIELENPDAHVTLVLMPKKEEKFVRVNFEILQNTRNNENHIFTCMANQFYVSEKYITAIGEIHKPIDGFEYINLFFVESEIIDL